MPNRYTGKQRKESKHDTKKVLIFRREESRRKEQRTTKRTRKQQNGCFVKQNCMYNKYIPIHNYFKYN